MDALKVQNARKILRMKDIVIDCCPDFAGVES